MIITQANYFQNLDPMLACHGPHTPQFTAALPAFALTFPQPPQTYTTHSARKFHNWVKIGPVYFQGEVVEGKQDGRGIILSPGNFIEYGYFR